MKSPDRADMDDATNLIIEKIHDAFRRLDPIQPQTIFVPDQNLAQVNVRHFEQIARDVSGGTLEFICGCENSPLFVGFKPEGARLLCIRCNGRERHAEDVA